jgi:hypothetical protein
MVVLKAGRHKLGSVSQHFDGSLNSFGKPRLAETRVDAATIFGQMASGASAKDIVKEYRLSRPNHRAGLGYVAH